MAEKPTMPDSILPKLADEALKPASSIIDALIAPKIARLRAWAVERDIKSHLNDDKLDKAFAAYLRRLMKRVSSVTTLVFPQQALDMEVIYEPLTLVQRYQQVSVSATDVCQCGVRTYIVDDAGMGKSTFAKHLVLEQIRSSDRIPVLLELRRITKEQTLIDAIAGELDSFGSAFDRQILPQLLSSGRFILVLDGFDEIPVDERLGRARQIEEIANKGEETTVLVTARPEVDLPAMPDVSVMQFKPLSKEQAKSLLLRYDKVGKCNHGRRLIQEIDTVPDRFLETPLLVALLYRTFSYNGAISTRVTSFYDEIYTALYKGHDLTKVGFTREKKSGLDVEDFRRLLRGFGFLMVAEEIESFSSESKAIALIERAVKLTSVQPTSSANF